MLARHGAGGLARAQRCGILFPRMKSARMAGGTTDFERDGANQSRTRSIMPMASPVQS
jgi:hypothetical protein